MKIIHICQRDDPDSGGSLRVAEALAREQRALGTQVWLLFLYGPPSHIAQEFKEYAICLELDSSRQVLKGIRLLRKTMARIEPDVIHSHDGILWPRLALLTFRIPIIMHSHLPAKISDLKSKAGWLLIKNTTHTLIGISQHTLQTWIRAGFPENRISHIANGVDFERFNVAKGPQKTAFRKKLGLPEEGRMILWVGRIHRSMKGSDRVERIASILPENTFLVVVGNGPDFVAIKERCRPLIETGRMWLTGSTAFPEDYYKAADLFLFTSYHEPFGLVILEAVASGIPIVAFPVTAGGGATDLLDEFEAVRLCDDASRQDVARAFDEALSLGRNQILREMARSKYDWSTIAGRVAEVYRAVLGQTESEPERLKVIVCQHGARHRYAIPRMLEQENSLAALYTDSSAQSFLGRFVLLLGRYAPDRWTKFARWEIRGISREKVYSSDSLYLSELVQRLFMLRKHGIYLYHQRHQRLSQQMEQWGLGNANVVYSMYHENLDFVRWAKNKGAKSVVDVFVSPLTDQILRREGRIFPYWYESPDEKAMQLERSLWKETAEVADLLLCPSEWVAQGVRETVPDAAHKIRVVPYGCTIRFKQNRDRAQVGRILFAGRDALRKGLHYLGQAATQLKEELPELDVRVAGEMPPDVVNHAVCKDLNFLGQLGTAQMEEEYQSTDVLVLPALSEGFAGVVAEAIGAGCPVIVTREAGSPIVDGREGLIVPSRDVDALACALRRMVCDRSFREHCASECQKQIAFYSEASWQSRLISALREGVGESGGDVGLARAMEAPDVV